MPQLVIADNHISISFYAAVAGISYLVEFSNDLDKWSSEGVTLSGPDTLRTATVSVSGPSRYLRLVVGD
jgi:hypothetical protein